MRLRHKFNAKRTVADGITFASKAEARRYEALKAAMFGGAVTMFLRQVPFHLPGNVKYLCDFLFFWADGSVTVEDVKGVKTPQYITKKKMVEAIYPVTISEIK